MTPALGRAAIVLAAAAITAACSSTHGDGWVAVGSGAGHGSATGAGLAATLPPVTGWEPGCVAAFAAASDAPPHDRFALLAQACPVCGVAWAPVLLATRLDPNETTAANKLAVDAVVKACGGACSGSARDQFLSAFDLIKDARSLDRPWRKLAKDCPGILWKTPDDRFASAPWYVLSQIGRALTGGHHGTAPTITVAASVELPLPGAMVSGGGIALPEATAILPDHAATHLTVLSSELRLARAPRVVLGPGGLTLPDVIDGEYDYPGAAFPLAELARALDQAPPGRVGILAPYASPASRVVAVVQAQGSSGSRRVHLAALGPPPAVGWLDVPRLLSPDLVAAPGTGDHVVIGIGGKGRVGTLAGSTVRDACASTGDSLDATTARALVARAHPAATPAVVLSVDTTAVVDELAAVIDALGAAGVETVALAPAKSVTWPAELPPCP